MENQFIDWNKLSINQYIEHLENKFAVDSSGTDDTESKTEDLLKEAKIYVNGKREDTTRRPKRKKIKKPNS